VADRNLAEVIRLVDIRDTPLSNDEVHALDDSAATLRRALQSIE